MTTRPTVAPPGEQFNIAQHLLATNQGRSSKAAFVDDQGALTFGQLDERVRRMAAALRAQGLRREERVLVLMLDSRLHHTGTVTISLGTVSEATAHPRDILRPVITHGCYGFILAHNHPSGDPSPSVADERITRRILEASQLMQIRFLDHLIVGRPSPGRNPYYSFREAGLVK